MPRFVSGSSGHVYSHKKLIEEGENNETSEVTQSTADQKPDLNSSVKKPSAINKKGTKEQQKSSLDLFKEELRRLNEERDQQRDKFKNNIASENDTKSEQSKAHQSQICIPLKPDPRCPTALTLQVNLNPRDKDVAASGSFDTGDPTTTNLYLGNLNPSVNENDLCDIFGKFGPLASIKVMWPRTDEERARNRNSGFVAYMSRIDAERAMRTLNGMEIRGYDLKLGWGKAVPLPQNPVFIPPDLVKLLEPPPYTGMPFNAQLHDSDLRRKYKVPNPLPKISQSELEFQSTENDTELNEMREQYKEFLEVLNRSTVRVVIPQNRSLVDRIHKTIEYVIRDGPVFEAIIIARERENPDFKFLYDNKSYEHVYYRWKLFSILHGDDPYKWRTDEFRMFDGGPIWKPPPLNPFADGMPVELIEKSTGVSRNILLNENPIVHNRATDCLDVRSTVKLHLNLSDTRQKGSLGQVKRPQFEQMLQNLEPTKLSIGSAMRFCINHSDAAQEVIDCIYDYNGQADIPLHRKVAIIYLISDVLHNCSAAVTNASFYRKGFQDKLLNMFESLHQYIAVMGENMQQAGVEAGSQSSQQKCDNFKHKILSVLGAWREWTLYEDDFIIQLSNILLYGARKASLSLDEQQKIQEESRKFALTSEQVSPHLTLTSVKQESEESLDGERLDEATLTECLEKKGLSLRWYKTLELSDDELEEIDQGANKTPGGSGNRQSVDGETQHNRKETIAPVKFKTSKWETVDPNEVAEQVVRLSKWEAIDAAQRIEKPTVPESPNQVSGSSSSFEDEDSFGNQPILRPGQKTKRFKPEDARSSSSSSS